jgi:death-on-curing protein
VKSLIFLTREAVEAIHEASLAEFGGGSGLRDPGLLESALAQPLNTHFYAAGDLFDCAAAYAYHIAENQPFIDGNKRAALLSALNFLAQNGVKLLRPTDEYYDAMIALSARRLDKVGLAALFRQQAD